MVRRGLAASGACLLGAIGAIGVACTSFGANGDTPVTDAGASSSGADVVAPLDATATTDTSTPKIAFDCTGARFCDDFERPATDVKGAWTLKERGGDTAILTNDRARAGDTALRFVTGVLGPANEHTVLDHELTRATNETRARLAFSFFAEKYDAKGHYNLGVLTFSGTGGGEALVTLLLRKDGLGLYFNSPGAGKHGGEPIPTAVFGAWHEVVNVDITNAKVDVTLDGSALFTGEGWGDTVSNFNKVKAGIGPDYSEVPIPITVDFDAVRVDLGD